MAIPVLTDMPAAVHAAASRNDRFYGNCTPAAPFVGGWIVEGRSVSYDPIAHAWLKAHGFIYRGRRWYRADDVGDQN